MENNLFNQLLYIFYASGMQALGKIKDPVSDEIAVNPEQAKQTIDMLEMIKEKTKNNLTEEESKVLEGFLSEIRLIYVDIINKSN
jgi:hypothetical protein